jgi:hypothetical protein
MSSVFQALPGLGAPLARKSQKPILKRQKNLKHRASKRVKYGFS